MELWIRSQDKRHLLLVKNISLTEYEDEGVCTLETDLENGVDLELGTYSTKERALEVLDEIQNKINLINLGHDFGSPMIDLKNPTYIYEMPKE